MHPWPSVQAPRDRWPLRLGVARERRRSARIPLRLAVEAYDASHYLGRFWTHDVSQEGVFLRTDRTDRLRGTILRLWFETDGVACSLRGAAVREVEGQGVGVQLAYCRPGDEAAHAAYRKLIAAPFVAPFSRGQVSAPPDIPETVFVARGAGREVMSPPRIGTLAQLADPVDEVHEGIGVRLGGDDAAAHAVSGLLHGA